MTETVAGDPGIEAETCPGVIAQPPLTSGRSPPAVVPHPLSPGTSSAPSGFGFGLLLVAGSGVDRSEVGLVVCSTFGEGDDVVDLFGEGLVADVADGVVSVEDRAPASGVGGGAEGCSELVASLL